MARRKRFKGDEAASIVKAEELLRFAREEMDAPPSPIAPSLTRPMPGQPTSPTIAGYQARTWKLDNKVMVVQLPPPSDLTKRDLEKMEKYIAALRAEAEISWEDASEE